MTKHFLISAFLVAVLFGAMSTSFSIEVKKTYEKKFPMEAGGQLTVRGDEGFIKVTSWDKPEVHLVWTKRIWIQNGQQAEKLLDLVEVRINQTGNRLNIKVVEPEHYRNFNFWDIFDPDTWGGHNFRSPVVDFELTVPREIDLSLTNDEGDVSVTSIEGDVAIEVDEGDIELSDINFADLDLSVDEGNIHGINLAGEKGSIFIETDEGKIDFEEVITNRLKAVCDEGDVTVKKWQGRFCDIATDEGDIEMVVLWLKDSRLDFATDEGNISLSLPDSPNVRFDLLSNDGGIRSNFDIKIVKKHQVQECHDRLGDGSSLLKAFADEGVITIKKQ